MTNTPKNAMDMSPAELAVARRKLIEAPYLAMRQADNAQAMAALDRKYPMTAAQVAERIRLELEKGQGK